MMLPLNIHWDSAAAIRTILDLHFPNGTILDVNYGLGVFYKKSDRRVIGVDIRPTGSVLADNKQLPFADNSFDIGVCDPPYRRGNGDKKYQERYGLAPYTQKRVTQSYLDLLPELLRVSRQGIIVKAQDETDGHRFYARQVTLINHIKSLTGLDPHDIAYLVKTGVPDNNVKGRNRHFMANCISMFIIYRWSSKNPFRAIRFTGQTPINDRQRYITEPQQARLWN